MKGSFAPRAQGEFYIPLLEEGVAEGRGSDSEFSTFRFQFPAIALRMSSLILMASLREHSAKFSALFSTLR